MQQESADSNTYSWYIYINFFFWVFSRSSWGVRLCNIYLCVRQRSCSNQWLWTVCDVKNVFVLLIGSGSSATSRFSANLQPGRYHVTCWPIVVYSRVCRVCVCVRRSHVCTGIVFTAVCASVTQLLLFVCVCVMWHVCKFFYIFFACWPNRGYYLCVAYDVLSYCNDWRIFQRNSDTVRLHNLFYYEFSLDVI